MKQPAKRALAALATTAVLATGLAIAAPAANATDNSITPTEAVSDLTAVGNTAISQAAHGYTQTLEGTSSLAGHETIAWDSVNNGILVTEAFGGSAPWTSLEFKTKQYVTIAPDAGTKVALGYLKAPKAKYLSFKTSNTDLVSEAARLFTGSTLTKLVASEAAVTGNNHAGVIDTATRVLAIDGSGEWVIGLHTYPADTGTDIETWDIKTNTSGLLTSIQMTIQGSPASLKITFNYTNPNIVAPKANLVVTSAAYNKALDAANLSASILGLAKQTAVDSKYEAVRNGRSRVWFKDIRHAAASAVVDYNTPSGNIKAHWKKGARGAVVYATNTYTHKVVSYLVYEHNGKASVKKVS